MELHCTLASADGGHPRGANVLRELVVESPEGTSGAEVAEALARATGARRCTVEGQPLEEMTLGSPPLVNGAVIVTGAPQQSGPRPVPPPLALVVHTGPSAGTVIPLGRGTLRIGRSPVGPGRHAVLADPELSREHAQIEVTDTAVVLSDRSSANGVWLDGQRVRRTPVTAGQRFRLGASVCTVAFTADAPLLDPAAGSAPASPLRVTRNTPPSRRAAMITMATLPLLVGVAMALATGMWMFLAFTAVSAVSLLIPLAEGRSARRDFERRLRAAADDDAARRLRVSPDAAVLTRSRGASENGASAAPTPRDDARAAMEATYVAARIPDEPPSVAHLRLGTAEQPANVVVEPSGSGVPPPTLRDAPLAVAAEGVLAVTGGPEAVLGLLRSLLLQLALLPMAAGKRIVVVGGSEELRLAARFLPRVEVLATDADQADLMAAAPTDTARILVAFPCDPSGRRGAEACVRVAIGQGWPVIAPAEATGGAPKNALIRLAGHRGHFRIRGSEKDFTPDLIPQGVFESAARHAGAGPVHRDDAGIPHQCGLDELIAADTMGIAAAWERTATLRGLEVPLGLSGSGRVTLDLVSEGPHLVVAGTTGSGKSELLRTLVAGAAATHAPDRVTFLFIDFKGGSGLEPLAGLPHCVGLVTDLADGGMDRTLVSLRAELKHRERLLSEARAADLDDYRRPAGGGLPRLVVVVDEFRILVEEAPAALAELMRVATVGRSLGMHLIMATQRPQGALSADIRANVTASIALRMQHEAESTDVLGSPLAARIPIGLPGRAYLSLAGGEPRPFQSASLGLATARVSRAAVRITDARTWLATGVASRAAIPPISPAQAAGPLVEAVASVWAAVGDGPVRRPIAPPLPDSLPLGGTTGPVGLHAADGTSDGAAADGTPDGTSPVRLGIVDLPHRQRTQWLTWEPVRDGHLALVGPAASGVPAALAAVLAQLADGVPTRHLYVLDADGSLHFLRDHPRVGAYVGLGDVRRAARLLTRLGEECVSRLATGSSENPATPLILAVTGWGSWISALRQSPQAWAEEALGELVRDGASTGLSVVTTGERELVASRVFGAIPARLFFPFGATDETRLSWPRLPAMPATRGRAGAMGTIVSGGPYAAQCYLLSARDSPDGVAGSAALHGPPHEASRRRRFREEGRPFRVDPLPARAPSDVVAALAAMDPDVVEPGGVRNGGPQARLRVVVGLAGDDVQPLALRLGAGEVLLVLGAPESGRSSFLEALPAMNPSVAFVAAAPGDRLTVWQEVLEETEGHEGEQLGNGPSYDQTDRGRSRNRRSPGPRVLVVDDADKLTPVENQVLTRLLEAGAPIVATAQYSATLYARCPVALAARSAGTGILIAPRAPSDGDVFGVRVDPAGRVPPGRAVAVAEGRQIDVQLGWNAPSSEGLPERPRITASRAAGEPA